jgi:hypothetical protein
LFAQTLKGSNRLLGTFNSFNQRPERSLHLPRLLFERGFGCVHLAGSCTLAGWLAGQFNLYHKLSLFVTVPRGEGVVVASASSECDLHFHRGFGYVTMHVYSLRVKKPERKEKSDFEV